MTTDPLLSLKERICELYESYEVLDILGLSTMDLLNAFELELTQSKELMSVDADE